MSSPFLNSLALVDPQNALNPHHRLNKGRTLWCLALPQTIGTKTWYDIAANRNGTPNLGAGTNGWRGDARPGGGQSLLLASSSGDVLNLPGTLANVITASDGTMACWVRWTDAFVTNPASYSLPSVLGDPINNYASIHIGTISGLSGLWAYTWDGGEKRVGGSYTLGTWARAMWVHTGGNLYLYINGVQEGSVAAGNTTNLGAYGAIWGGGGSVDDVAFWNRGLSADEALEDYEESIAGYPTVLNRISLMSLFSIPPPAGGLLRPLALDGLGGVYMRDPLGV